MIYVTLIILLSIFYFPVVILGKIVFTAIYRSVTNKKYTKFYGTQQDIDILSMGGMHDTIGKTKPIKFKPVIDNNKREINL